ncbi:MAG: hypothetical protein QF441_04985 [Bacteriovoracaceae bacterium]|jgi:hypothetical protein|nr:hypothetical protein [Halobacteriovoraceae bacterium]MDP7319938.1 hypothetical protein [Bacteriovoracaceae bacterium]
MAIEDLDLEFEDEEEKTRSDALDLDIDLSFSASPAEEVKKQLKGVKVGDNDHPVQNNNINRATKNQPKLKVLPKQNKIESDEKNKANISIEAKNESRTPDVKRNGKKIDEVRSSLGEVERLKTELAITKAQRNYLVEYVSNAKLLDYQLTQILLRLRKKHPESSAEIQQMKKLLVEFIKNSSPQK